MKSQAAVLDTPTLPALELIPPREADVEGVFKMPGSSFHNRIIYTETEVDLEATKASARIKTDKNGNEIWKRNAATGEPLYPILVKEVTYRRRRYVLNADNRNRHVKKIYNFEPTAAELATIAQKEAEQTFFRDFVAEAAKAGLSAAQLVARLKADIVGPGENPDAVELDVTEEVIAAEMAKLDGDMINRPDGDEEAIGPDEAKPDMVIGATPVQAPAQRRRKPKGDPAA